MPKKNAEAGAETAAESSAKQEIHEKVASLVKEKTTKNIGRAGGKAIFDTVVQMIFAAAVKDGSFRFPGGYGSFHVRQLNEGTKPKRLPSGATTTIGAGRKKLRYVEGNEVKSLMGTRKKPASEATASTESVSPASV